VRGVGPLHERPDPGQVRSDGGLRGVSPQSVELPLVQERLRKPLGALPLLPAAPYPPRRRPLGEARRHGVQKRSSSQQRTGSGPMPAHPATLVPGTGSRLTLILLAMAVVAGPIGAQEGTGHFDLLLRGGRVLGGTGTPWFRADVGIRDGRIAAVGLLPHATADRVEDMTGRTISPGFMDPRSHAHENSRAPNLRDHTLRREGAPTLVAPGIATVVMNPVGGSPRPILSQGSTLERGGMGTNVPMMVGHGEVRGQVLPETVWKGTVAALSASSPDR